MDLQWEDWVAAWNFWKLGHFMILLFGYSEWMLPEPWLTLVMAAHKFLCQIIFLFLAKSAHWEVTWRRPEDKKMKFKKEKCYNKYKPVTLSFLNFIQQLLQLFPSTFQIDDQTIKNPQAIKM